MKLLFIILFSFLMGALVISTPDIVSLYADAVSDKYQEKVCAENGIDITECAFDLYYTPYKKERN